MSTKDIIVFVFYIAGNILVSVALARKIKNSSDYFAAGRQSAWWLSGLSAFMTMFSAGTFVVWGGIAFRLGMVAVLITMCLGVSALLVGKFLAGTWRKLGVSSAAEYIHKRFGSSVLNFYTGFNIFYRLFGMAVALYSLAVVLQVFLPKEQFNNLFTPFHLGFINGTIVFCGIVIVLYAIFGGLWAVLMTDVLQFIVLMVAVVLAIPLIFHKIGGVGAFIDQAPNHFFQPVAGEFGWFFLVGWMLVHYFKIGGEWAFVQRYICVPTEREAKKSAYLFGVLYLISPIIWMLPPMLYRVIDPSANPEQAYILACKYALPEGLIGLMIASMFAATVSMIDSELNVFAGVLTKDFYIRIFPGSTELRQVNVGRFFTLLLGGIVVCLAIIIPRMGGAEEVVLVITSLLAGPMIIPVIWGMYSRKIDRRTVFTVVIFSSVISVFLEFGCFSDHGWFSHATDSGVIAWLQQNSRTLEPFVGTVIPIMTLVFLEKIKSTKSVRSIELGDKREKLIKTPRAPASLFPAMIIAIAMAILGVLLLGLALTDDQDQTILLTATVILFALGIVIFMLIKKEEKSRSLVGVLHEERSAKIRQEEFKILE